MFCRGKFRAHCAPRVLGAERYQGIKMKDRIQAFGVHLGLSVFIALLVLVLVFYIWYPAPLHKAVGVTHIFLLLLTVDVILGPCLTFVIFKKGKKTLKFDLAVIAALQFTALSYGLYTVAEGRPAWLVFAADRFDLVRVMDLDTRYPERVKEPYRSVPWLGPRWVAALPPEDQEENSTLTLEAVFSGFDLPQRPYLYAPLEAAGEMIKAKALPLNELGKFNEADAVETALKDWPQADAWLPLMSNAKPMVVLLDQSATDIQVLAVVDLHPWS